MQCLPQTDTISDISELWVFQGRQIIKKKKKNYINKNLHRYCKDGIVMEELGLVEEFRNDLS